MHPDELVPRSVGHPLYSFDFAAFLSNLSALVDMGNQHGLEIVGVTVGEVAQISMQAEPK